MDNNNEVSDPTLKHFCIKVGCRQIKKENISLLNYHLNGNVIFKRIKENIYNIDYDKFVELIKVQYDKIMSFHSNIDDFLNDNIIEINSMLRKYNQYRNVKELGKIDAYSEADFTEKILNDVLSEEQIIGYTMSNKRMIDVKFSVFLNNLTNLTYSIDFTNHRGEYDNYITYSLMNSIDIDEVNIIKSIKDDINRKLLSQEIIGGLIISKQDEIRNQYRGYILLHQIEIPTDSNQIINKHIGDYIKNLKEKENEKISEMSIGNIFAGHQLIKVSIEYGFSSDKFNICYNLCESS